MPCWNNDSRRADCYYSIIKFWSLAYKALIDCQIFRIPPTYWRLIFSKSSVICSWAFYWLFCKASCMNVLIMYSKASVESWRENRILGARRGCTFLCLRARAGKARKKIFKKTYLAKCYICALLWMGAGRKVWTHGHSWCSNSDNHLLGECDVVRMGAKRAHLSLLCKVVGCSAIQKNQPRAGLRWGSKVLLLILFCTGSSRVSSRSKLFKGDAGMVGVRESYWNQIAQECVAIQLGQGKSQRRAYKALTSLPLPPCSCCKDDL